MKKWFLSLVECFLEKDTSRKIRVPRNDPIKNPNDALSLDHGTLGHNTYTSSIKLEHPSNVPDHLLPLLINVIKRIKRLMAAGIYSYSLESVIFKSVNADRSEKTVATGFTCASQLGAQFHRFHRPPGCAKPPFSPRKRR